MKNKEETLEDMNFVSNTKMMTGIEISEKDVEVAIKKIKLGKAGGIDGILGEFIKYGGNELKKELVKLFENIIEKGRTRGLEKKQSNFNPHRRRKIQGLH